MSEEVTIYIVQYALSEGIIEAKATISDDGYARLPRGERFSGFLGPSRFRLTRSEAAKVAEGMRIRKISSVEKQLAKLRAMTFEDS